MNKHDQTKIIKRYRLNITSNITKYKQETDNMNKQHKQNKQHKYTKTDNINKQHKQTA